MVTALLIGNLVIGIAAAIAAILAMRGAGSAPQAVFARFDTLDKSGERVERAARDEITRSREESAVAARDLRQEVGTQLDATQRSLLEQLGSMREAVERRLEAVRGTLDEQIRRLQEDNGQKLEQMRATVDEKLQGTLEKRLGDSFRLVSERLEQVQRGLGEMHTLAVGVGDLKRVLTNVKTRGGWGEVQLGAILDQLLAPEQFVKNFHPREGGGEHVEFAVKMPGRNSDSPVYLCIDAKFPVEDYQRLVSAQEQCDVAAVEETGKALEQRIKSCAEDVFKKYIVPPITTDFALIFLPTEGLYAEVARRGDLVAELQARWRVIVVGPTNLAALLNSLQMGFRTLAVEQRSSEVFHLLGAVKSEFGKFGDVLAKLRDKLTQASTTISSAEVRTRQIARKLKSVEELPADQAQALLPAALPFEEDGLDD